MRPQERGRLGQLCSRLKAGGTNLCEANWYINPGLGTGTNAGTSWANAFNSTTLAWTAAIAASAAGDDFYVNAASTVSNASAQTLTFKGTPAAPNRVFSCTGITNNPPTSADYGPGAAHTTTGAFGQIINGCVEIDGVVFNVGTGTTGANFTVASVTNSEVTLNNCSIKMLVTVATCSVIFSGAVNAKATLINTPITFNGGASSGITIGNGLFTWKYTPSAIQGTAAIANLFNPSGNTFATIVCDGVDFAGGTGIASGKNLTLGSGPATSFQFVNCKTIAGVLIGRPTTPFSVIDQILTDSGATTFKQQRDMYQGTLTADTGVFNGATDGTTQISWKVITTANAKPQSPFECFAISKKIAAGTYAASKIFLTSATAGLKTNDVWVEGGYPGGSFALSTPFTSFGAGSGTGTLPQIPAGTTPGTLAAASPAWGTGGLGNDYQLAIPSFTVAADGEVWFFVKVGKASLTVNVDPKVVVA